MTVFLRRVAVAAWGIPLLLGTAYAGGWFWRLVLAVKGLLAVRELVVLGGAGRDRVLAFGLGAYAVLAILAIRAGDTGRLMLLGTLAFSGTVLLSLFRAPREGFRTVTLGALGLAYPVLPLVHLAWLRDGSGWPVVWLLFALLWLGDTAAYVGGRLTGRHPLAPLLSPNKTREGALWALGFTALGAAGARTIWPPPVPPAGAWVALAVAVWFFGTLGDLFESLLKRSAGVKDSGRLLGAHGGVLDRFDSLFFSCLPVYYLAVWLW